MPDDQGNAFEFKAGPASARASGETVINVILAMCVVGMSFYGIWTINQQSLMIHQEHYAIMLNLGQLTRANENVFLSSMLPNERKAELPSYIQDRAREIVENRAANITGNTPKGPTP